VFAVTVVREAALTSIAHSLFHLSTTRFEPVCYLQDLFTHPQQRGQGVGKALIRSVYERAKSAGASRVYWQTQASNEAGRELYDQGAKHFGFIVYSHEIPVDANQTLQPTPKGFAGGRVGPCTEKAES